MFASSGVSTLLGQVTRTVQTFYSTTNWVAPSNVSRLISISGAGEPGTPGTPDTTQTGWHRVDVEYAHLRSDGSVSSWIEGTYPDVYDGSPTPDSYFDPTVYYSMSDSTVYSDSTLYHSFTSTSRTVPGQPAYNGADTTAVGLTFPGGSGGPSSTTTYTNVAVTPNTSYPMTIPGGGYITITY